MPFTPYHFGPAGLVALPLYKRMDMPLFILANVAVDIEVLVDMKFFPGLPVHGFCHTLIGSTIVGLTLALFSFHIKKLIKRGMSLIKLDYQPCYFKMVLGAVLGAWLHVIIDAFCWYDVAVFWPFQKYSKMYRLLGENSAGKVKLFCLICLALFVVFYAIKLAVNHKGQTLKAEDKNEKTY